MHKAAPSARRRPRGLHHGWRDGAVRTTGPSSGRRRRRRGRVCARPLASRTALPRVVAPGMPLPSRRALALARALAVAAAAVATRLALALAAARSRGRRDPLPGNLAWVAGPPPRVPAIVVPVLALAGGYGLLAPTAGANLRRAIARTARGALAAGAGSVRTARAVITGVVTIGVAVRAGSRRGRGGGRARAPRSHPRRFSGELLRSPASGPSSRRSGRRNRATGYMVQVVRRTDGAVPPRGLTRGQRGQYRLGPTSMARCVSAH